MLITSSAVPWTISVGGVDLSRWCIGESSTGSTPIRATVPRSQDFGS